MRRALQAAALGLLVLALAFAGPRLHAPSGPATSGASHVAPMASINLGELFGDENEPDENEPDEGGSRAQPEDQAGSSGVSFPVILVFLALAAALGGYVYFRVRRLVLRLRSWGRDLWARL
jgi:hypothetical protein